MSFRIALFALVSSLLSTAPAAAAVLPVNSTYTFQFADNSQVPALSITGSGIGSSNGFGASFSVPAGMFSGHAGVSGAVAPTLVGLTAISIPANSANNPAATFNLGGVMAMSGSAIFNSGAGGSIPLHPAGGNSVASVILPGGIPVKVVGQAWQYDAGKIFTAMGGALANALSATATAFDNRNGAGQGTVQLVAPAYALISGGALGNMPIFATLTLTYTPEPGTLVLLGAGVATLAAIGRRKL
jgi:hypothetical protein